MPGQTTRTVENLSGEEWKVLSQATERLERFWQANTSGEEPNLTRFLPGVSDVALAHRILIELLKIDQEYRWGKGQKKLLEDYLREWPELETDTEGLRELLEAECLTRTSLEDIPSEDELKRRFPSLGDDVDLEALSAQAHCENLPRGQVLPAHPDRPESFGRYRIESELGSGGMGTVFRAFDPSLNRHVAIKIPHIDPNRESEIASQFQEEAKAAGNVKHPNICVIHDSGIAEGKPYLVMEFIPGQNLEDRLSQGPLPPKEAVALVGKLADALDRFHQQGLIHRDVKPSNVMRKDDGEPILMDFGLAQQTCREAGTTIPKSLRGTPAYIAPEILTDKDHAPDERSDIYSLGVLLYHCLTGCPPFQGELTDVLRDVAEREPPPVRHVCPDADANLEKICQWAMAKSPGSRFQTAADFAFALKLWCDRPNDPTPVFPRWPLALAAACGLGFMAVSAALIWIRNNPVQTKDVSPPHPLAQTDAQPLPQGIAPREEHLEANRQIAGAPLLNPRKDEPESGFENAWILPLDEAGTSRFADKIDPETDVDMYLIETNQPGLLKFTIAREPDLKLLAELFDTNQDLNSDGKPDGVDTTESSEGHHYCDLLREVTQQHRLYLRISSQVRRSRGKYEVRVRSLKNDSPSRPGPSVAQESNPGHSIDPAFIEEMQELFDSATPTKWVDSAADSLRRRLVAACQAHRGHAEIRRFGQWLDQLPWPQGDTGNLRFLDMTLAFEQIIALPDAVIPNDGALIIRDRIQRSQKKIHVIEGWRAGSLTIQVIPLDENTGGQFELKWGRGSDSYGEKTIPFHKTYSDVIGSASGNTVRLHVEIGLKDTVNAGDYILLLWQPEDMPHRN